MKLQLSSIECGGIHSDHLCSSFKGELSFFAWILGYLTLVVVTKVSSFKTQCSLCVNYTQLDVATPLYRGKRKNMKSPLNIATKIYLTMEGKGELYMG